MPSRLDHAWRAASISPRCISVSALGAHSAATNVLITSRGSFEDSPCRSLDATAASLHHEGGAAAAAPVASSVVTLLITVMHSLFMIIPLQYRYRVSRCRMAVPCTRRHGAARR